MRRLLASSPACSLRRPTPALAPLPADRCRRRSLTPPRLLTAGFSTAAAADDEAGPSHPRFSYHVAASFIAKDHPFNPLTHLFQFSPYHHVQQPRPGEHSSRPESGHDAFFVSRVHETGAIALGVADGVGGWVDSGVDPGDFSHTLCHYMADLAHGPSQFDLPLTARRLMQRGYDAMYHDGIVRAGGSTACVAIASPDGHLDVANLGDSGFLHLRLNAVHAYSEPQTHDFNTPYQLSLLRQGTATRMAAFGGAPLSDLPRDADVTHHRVRHGDVLVLATDGVLDNLFNQNILRIASRVMVSRGAWAMAPDGVLGAARSLDALVSPVCHACSGPTETLQSTVATELVAAAKAASINTKVNGPFAKEVKKYYPHERWQGGKVDDICVVVAVVCQDSPPSPHIKF